MKKLLTIVLVFSVFAVTAQEKKETKEERQQRYIEEVNPFKELGYKPKIATLSKGKYREAFPDTIVQIGSFTYNKMSKQIASVQIIDDTRLSESDLKPEIVSRWMSPDPLSEEFPEWSPYNFVYNNPIRFIDPTGLAPEDLILKGSQKALGEVADNINASLGEGAVSIAKDGNVTLNVSRDDLETDAQKGLFDALNAPISNEVDTVIEVVQGDNSILAGSYSGEVIDIDDINAFGDGEAANQQSILGHEVTEQFEKQVNGASRPVAHAAGEATEASITGFTRLKDDTFNETSRSTVTGRVTNGYGRTRTRTNVTTSGIGGFNYSNGTKNLKVQYTSKNKNIVKVERKNN